MPNNPKFRTVLLKCTRLFTDQLNSILSHYDLNYSLWQVIYLVKNHQKINSIELSRELNVSKPSIAKRIHVLHSMDLIEFENINDKRQKILVLTQTGLDIYQRCTVKIDQYEQQLLKQFEDAEIAQTTKILTDLLSILELEKSTQGNTL